MLLFAIPNGGDRNAIVAKKLKAEGVLAGIPDLYLACPSWDSDQQRPIHGLYVEMKRALGGRVQPEQAEIHTLLRRAGYQVVVAHGWQPAADAIEAYLERAKHCGFLPNAT